MYGDVKKKGKWTLNLTARAGYSIGVQNHRGVESEGLVAIQTTWLRLHCSDKMLNGTAVNLNKKLADEDSDSFDLTGTMRCTFRSTTASWGTQRRLQSLHLSAGFICLGAQVTIRSLFRLIVISCSPYCCPSCQGRISPPRMLRAQPASCTCNIHPPRRKCPTPKSSWQGKQ